MKMQLCDVYDPWLKYGPFLDHDLRRKFTQHEIIFPMVYNVKGFGKVKNYLDINDVIAITSTARISS